MNCLNRIEIQRYIDGEVSAEEKDAFLKHMETCSLCKSLWDQAKLEINQTNQIISLAQMDEDQIPIPGFIQIPVKTLRKKWIIYSSVAAGILIIVGVFLNQMIMKNTRNERIENAKLEIERYIYDSDPNKLWNEKESIITIIDEDGNLIYLNN